MKYTKIEKEIQRIDDVIKMKKNDIMEYIKVGEVTIEAAKKYKNVAGGIMMALHEVQNAYGYISKENQKYLSEKLNVPLSEIYGIITFYNRFTLVPKGKYNVQVCLGTACHVQGADSLFEAAKKFLGIDNGETTEDGMFSLEAVRCLGACGLAPAVVINGEVYGKVTVKRFEEILNEIKG